MITELERLRLMHPTPVPCRQPAVAARRSDLFGHVGYGYCPSHSRWYWGTKLLVICTCDGTVTGFSLANPKLAGERDQASQTLEYQPANRPALGTLVVTDSACPDRAPRTLLRRRPAAHPHPARPQGREAARSRPNWLRRPGKAVPNRLPPNLTSPKLTI